MIRLSPLLLILPLVMGCGAAPPQPDPVAKTTSSFQIAPRVEYAWPMQRPPEQRGNDCVVTPADGSDFPRFFVERVTGAAVSELGGQIEGTLKTSLCTSLITLSELRPGKALITVMLTGTLMQAADKSPARCRFYAHEEADLAPGQTVQSMKPFHGGCTEQF